MRVSSLFYFVLLSLLALRFLFFFTEAPHYKEGDTITLNYTFLQEAKHNSFGQYFVINGMLVSFSNSESYKYGDKVIIKGTVGIIKSKKGQRLLTIKNPRIDRLDKSPVLAIIALIRQKIIDGFERVLPPKESGLFLGIVLGIKDKIDSQYYDQLKTVGILHVVAASGSNVSLLASFLLSFIQHFVKRKWSILFTAFGILFYSLISGFDPPIVRSSVMALVAFFALLLGRQNSSVRALFLTAALMLLLDPILLGDVGFQLSFASTLGILYLKPIIDRVLRWRFYGIIRDDLGTTLAAQFATLPIMLISFQSYSLLSVITNILLLWTIPPLMVLGLVASLVTLVWVQFAIPFLYLAHPFLIYFERIVTIFSQTKQIEVGSIPLTIIAGYYGLVLSIIWVINKNMREKKK